MTGQGDLFSSSGDGERRRDLGKSAVTENAGERWRAAFRAAGLEYVSRLPPGRLFAAEEMRAWALSRGVSKPHHHNAWSAMSGAILRELVKAQRIRPAGHRLARSVKTHAHLIRQYEVLASAGSAAA